MPFSFGGALIFKWQQLGSAFLRGKGVGRAFFKDLEGGGGASFPFFAWIIWHMSISETLRRAVFDSQKAAPGPGFQASFSGCRVRRGWGQTWGGALWVGSGGGEACDWSWQQVVRSQATMLQLGPSQGSTSVTLWGWHYFLCWSPCGEWILQTFSARFFFLIHFAPTYADLGMSN